VKLIYCCLFFGFLSADIDFFLFLSCEELTPGFLLEIANRRFFYLFSSFKESVKFVIAKLMQIFLIYLFTA